MCEASSYSSENENKFVYKFVSSKTAYFPINGGEEVNIDGS